MSINLLAPINYLGYGHVGRYVTKGLSERTPLHLTILGQSDNQESFIRESVNRPYFKDADCVRIYHQFSLKEFIGKGRHIGFPIFELDTFTADEKHQLNNLDMLFVCSEWAKEVCVNNGIKTKTHVIPLGVDTGIFNSGKSTNSDKTIFFNCGKWEVRKGHLEIAEAFKTFNSDDNVELWMMCDNPFYTPAITNEFLKKFIQHPIANKIKMIPRVQNHLQVSKIMAATTAGVFPARAEGWCMPMLEMMSLGKHIITTNYSGHTEYCNKENAHLIQPTGMETANDNIWFKGQGNWCKFDTADLAQQMREIHNQNTNGTLSENTAGIETANRFTWDNTAEKILNAINTN